MLPSLLVAALLICGITAAPAVSEYKHVLHEKRDGIPHGWAKTDQLSARSIIPVRIGLSQANLDRFDDYMNSVSEPSSSSYGQHWTAKQVAEIFAPSDESHEAVRQWLESTGISRERVETSQSLGWVTVKATVEEAERLLKTKYHLFEHESGVPHVACEAYFVPENIAHHIGMSFT